jgi:transposase
MPAITLQNIGKYSYIYLSYSKWDANKKYSSNSKIKIGKIHPVTGEAIFSPEFLEKLHESPELLDKTKARFPDAIINIGETTVKTLPKKPIGRYPGENISIGITYFLYNIAESIGLLKPLKESFPDDWKKIFTVASFLIFENKAIMECDDFIEENLTFPVGTLSSQRTSELFFNISKCEYNNFFSKWLNFITEREYIAFDSTNISSYSEQNDLVEYGKAKANPELKQVNLCLLYGKQSKLPIYQTVYSGSLNDVSIIMDVIKEFESIVGSSDILIVNDKRFYSKDNIIGLLKNTNVKFLAAVPFNNKDANDILDVISKSNVLDASSSIIYTNHDSIRGTTQLRTWYNSHKFYTHIFFDCFKALQADTHFKEDLKTLRELYLNDELTNKDYDLFNKYFIVDNSIPKKYKHHIIDNTDEFNTHLRHEGWLILISNHIKNIQDAYNLYINKDCVKKAFMNYKQNLGMNRIYTGNSKRFTNKAVIAFIALILNSHIQQVMSSNNFYKKMSQSKLLRQMNRIDAFLDIDGKYYEKNLTKKQKEILEIFNVKIPNRYIVNHFIKNILK